MTSSNKLSYDQEENIYTFYVDGKLIEVDNASSLVLTQVGTPKPISAKNDKYVEKKFNISILRGGSKIKTWENVKIQSVDMRNIHFKVNGIAMSILPSVNERVIIQEKITISDVEKLKSLK